ncbi:hypothetical protein [Streptomyces sp. GC420]|uniref:hypothetical protein n=1 Tax=Streptomyces sp. GC420 TaxID=2697568 RepID=UPI001414FA4C|nr:hypothetical protein [Streptomyces sp. GC420]NBM16154.1 hypothetical protein [Streptomyces sp. GC420]
MQISESATYMGGNTSDEAVQDHPAGQVTLAVGGALGLRSRLLSSTQGSAGYTNDFPWTTMTSPA